MPNKIHVHVKLDREAYKAFRERCIALGLFHSRVIASLVDHFTGDELTVEQLDAICAKSRKLTHGPRYRTRRKELADSGDCPGRDSNSRETGDG
jgi:hypothetical protein